MILCGYDVDCENVLDLTSRETRLQLQIEFEDLACPWKDLATQGIQPPSWAMMQKLRSQKIAGIIVPSFAKGASANDINAVFWQWGNRLPHKVKAVDDHNRLPKNMSSWT